MSMISCVMCGFDHESYNSKCQTWSKGHGWSCDKWFVSHPLELVPQYIKEDQIKNAPDMIQRYRQGELSREFVETYPEQVKGMLKEGIISKEQVRKSKNVWNKDMKGISDLPHKGAAEVLGKE